MKHRLTWRETIFVSSMLFGMFFGAGNLIFPVSMGQMSGSHVWKAAAGFLVTGVGLPLLGVAALGISRETGLLGLAGRAGKRFGACFTCALYLTIGPFFAIPRCATVSYTVGIEGVLGKNNETLFLALFSFIFFLAVLFFSLRPGQIMIWIGKILNPLFLFFLAVLFVRALSAPMGKAALQEAYGAYHTQAFFTGFLEGYNTMDALAGLAFGIVVIDVIKRLGVTEPGEVAASTVRAGIYSALLMAVIYVLAAVLGAQSTGGMEVCSNGGEALSKIARHYFGNAGAVILAVTVTLACLKTAVGLLTSCGEAFCEIFPGRISYTGWVLLFSAGSFLAANLGLSAILSYSEPVLLILYPPAVVLTVITLAGVWWNHDPKVLRWSVGFTSAAAILDGLRALPDGTKAWLHLDGATEAAASILPLSRLGLGWLCPAAAGTAAGLLLHIIFRKNAKRKNRTSSH